MALPIPCIGCCVSQQLIFLANRWRHQLLIGIGAAIYCSVYRWFFSIKILAMALSNLTRSVIFFSLQYGYLGNNDVETPSLQWYSEEWLISKWHFVECHFVEWHFVECHFVEWHFVEWHSVEWHLVEWHLLVTFRRVAFSRGAFSRMAFSRVALTAE